MRATGVVVDNEMTTNPHRRLVFSPVVEFRSAAGHTIHATAHQQAVTSWPRGAAVEVAYDPQDPQHFVLASSASRNEALANAVVALLVVGIIVGTMVGMYHLWEQFRYDRNDPAQPSGTGDATPVRHGTGDAAPAQRSGTGDSAPADSSGTGDSAPADSSGTGDSAPADSSGTLEGRSGPADA
jgi:hypothetical protein